MLRKIYRHIHRRVPNKLRGQLTRLSWNLSGKPFVKKDALARAKKFPPPFLGGAIISLDFELAWAFRYSRNGPDPLTMARQARQNFPILLDMFDTFSIPVTWATVGHLFLKSCRQEDHKWMSRIPYFGNRHWKFSQGDWFDHDPGCHWQEATAWYAPDLIEAILDQRIKHELGCHTFSHIDFGDKFCPIPVAEDEIKASIQAAAPYNLRLRSMVFPGGTFGNIATLKKYDFQIYRKNTPFDLSYPYPDDLGLLVTPTTAGLGDRGYGWQAEYYLRRFHTYIKEAMSSGTVCHLWLHPSIDSWFLDKVLPGILEKIASYHQQKMLWIGTMGDLAQHITNNKLYR